MEVMSSKCGKIRLRNAANRSFEKAEKFCHLRARVAAQNYIHEEIRPDIIVEYLQPFSTEFLPYCLKLKT
jgi:hypothetical protein